MLVTVAVEKAGDILLVVEYCGSFGDRLYFESATILYFDPKIMTAE